MRRWRQHNMTGSQENKSDDRRRPAPRLIASAGDAVEVVAGSRANTATTSAREAEGGENQPKNRSHVGQQRACAAMAADWLKTVFRKRARSGADRTARGRRDRAHRGSAALRLASARSPPPGICQSVNGLPPASRSASSRATSTGSSGAANGNLSMTTTLSASPATSTPSQKLAAPSSTPFPDARKSVSSRCRGAVPCTNNGKSTRCGRISAARRSARCEVNRRNARPREAARAPAAPHRARDRRNPASPDRASPAADTRAPGARIRTGCRAKACAGSSSPSCRAKCSKRPATESVADVKIHAA